MFFCIFSNIALILYLKFLAFNFIILKKILIEIFDPLYLKKLLYNKNGILILLTPFLMPKHFNAKFN